MYINSRYDPVVNNLNFNESAIPAEIVGDMQFDPAVYDDIENSKGYLEFIKQNFKPELTTFGGEYIE